MPAAFFCAVFSAPDIQIISVASHDAQHVSCKIVAQHQPELWTALENCLACYHVILARELPGMIREYDPERVEKLRSTLRDTHQVS